MQGKHGKWDWGKKKSDARRVDFPSVPSREYFFCNSLVNLTPAVVSILAGDGSEAGAILGAL